MASAGLYAIRGIAPYNHVWTGDHFMSDNPPESAPEPFTRGTFALFDLPDGGLVLALNVAGHGEITRPIPAPFVAIARQLAAGQEIRPATILRAFTRRSETRRELGGS